MDGETLSVLIVDDEPDMLALLRRTIERSNKGLSVVGQASNGSEAVATWRNLRPDAVVLDERMPIQTGLEAAKEILGEAPEQRLILFSAYLDDDILKQAAAIGVSACVEKHRMTSIPEVLWNVAAA